MRIFKQLGFIFIVIALVLLFRKYPTLGIILAIIWFSRRFFTSKRKSSSANVYELKQINKNIENLTIVLNQLAEAYQFQTLKKDPVAYFEAPDRANSSFEEEKLASNPYY